MLPVLTFCSVKLVWANFFATDFIGLFACQKTFTPALALLSGFHFGPAAARVNACIEESAKSNTDRSRYKVVVKKTFRLRNAFWRQHVWRHSFFGSLLWHAVYIISECKSNILEQYKINERHLKLWGKLQQIGQNISHPKRNSSLIFITRCYLM